MVNDKREKYVVARMEAVKLQRLADDIKDSAATKAIQARKAEEQVERQKAVLKAVAEKAATHPVPNRQSTDSEKQCSPQELGATANDGVDTNSPLLAGVESFPLLADAEVLDRPSDDSIDRCMSEAHNEETEIKRHKSKKGAVVHFKEECAVYVYDAAAPYCVPLKGDYGY